MYPLDVSVMFTLWTLYGLMVGLNAQLIFHECICRRNQQL